MRDQSLTPAPLRRRSRPGVPWSEEEHRLFLVGLQKLGKARGRGRSRLPPFSARSPPAQGNWRGIARGFVHTRTPTQVGSHAQKYFLRQSSASKRGRASLFDMVAAPAGQEDTPARVTAPRSSRGTPAARAESVPPLLPGAPQLFGGAPSGTSAADLLAQAGVELLPDGDESPEGAVSAQAAIHRMLWQQWLAAGGGEPRGAGFHRGPVELALLHNPLLVRPTPVRADASTWATMRKSASMPELAALALSSETPPQSFDDGVRIER